MIIYFSGTGNSRYTAEIISLVTGDETLSMNEQMKNKNNVLIASRKPLVFVAPVYAGRIPRVVEKYITGASFEGNNNVYFIVTCASTPWDTDSYLKKLCRKKGFNLLGCNSVIMPQNNIAFSDIQSDSDNDKVLVSAKPKIQEIAENISNNRPLAKEKPGKAIMSKIINPIMYSLMINAKGFYATKVCSGCGLCAVRCPLNNIKITDNKPMWGKSCTHCMACICGCSEKAIEYGKKTKGRNRYFNTKTPQL